MDHHHHHHRHHHQKQQQQQSQHQLPQQEHRNSSKLIDNIVCEVKSQGVFDQFRRDCMADVDTKPAYQNLRQRVETSVTNFLNEQQWNPDLNKNQLREKLRKNITETGFLETGVERIVDQVVNPKINTVFLPKIEDISYKYLGIEKPIRMHDTKTNNMLNNSLGNENNGCSDGDIGRVVGIDRQLEINTTDFLLNDLEAVSPDSDHDVIENREKSMSPKRVVHDYLDISDSSLKIDSLNDSGEKVLDDFESPAFEPLEGRSMSAMSNEEDLNNISTDIKDGDDIDLDNNHHETSRTMNADEDEGNSKLSDISGLTSQDSIESCGGGGGGNKVGSNVDYEMSKKMPIESTEEDMDIEKTPNEDSMNSFLPSSKYSTTHEYDDGPITPPPCPPGTEDLPPLPPLPTIQPPIHNDSTIPLINPDRFNINAESHNQDSVLSQVSSNSRLSIVTNNSDLMQMTQQHQSSDDPKLSAQITPKTQDHSEEAQMPKFNESSSDNSEGNGPLVIAFTNSNSSINPIESSSLEHGDQGLVKTSIENKLPPQSFSFDIKKDEIKFEGTDRRRSFELNDNDNKIFDYQKQHQKQNTTHGNGLSNILAPPLPPLPPPPPPPPTENVSNEESNIGQASSTPTPPPLRSPQNANDIPNHTSPSSVLTTETQNLSIKENNKIDANESLNFKTENSNDNCKSDFKFETPSVVTDSVFNTSSQDGDSSCDKLDDKLKGSPSTNSSSHKSRKRDKDHSSDRHSSSSSSQSHRDKYKDKKYHSSSSSSHHDRSSSRDHRSSNSSSNNKYSRDGKSSDYHRSSSSSSSSKHYSSSKDRSRPSSHHRNNDDPSNKSESRHSNNDKKRNSLSGDSPKSHSRSSSKTYDKSKSRDHSSDKKCKSSPTSSDKLSLKKPDDTIADDDDHSMFHEKPIERRRSTDSNDGQNRSVGNLTNTSQSTTRDTNSLNSSSSSSIDEEKNANNMQTDEIDLNNTETIETADGDTDPDDIIITDIHNKNHPMYLQPNSTESDEDFLLPTLPVVVDQILTGNEINLEMLIGQQNNIDPVLTTIHQTLTAAGSSLKMKKPKVASNIFEARKLMKVRKQIEREEKKRIEQALVLAKQYISNNSIIANNYGMADQGVELEFACINSDDNPVPSISSPIKSKAETVKLAAAVAATIVSSPIRRSPPIKIADSNYGEDYSASVGIDETINNLDEETEDFLGFPLKSMKYTFDSMDFIKYSENLNDECISYLNKSNSNYFNAAHLVLDNSKQWLPPFKKCITDGDIILYETRSKTRKNVQNSSTQIDVKPMKQWEDIKKIEDISISDLAIKQLKELEGNTGDINVKIEPNSSPELRDSPTLKTVPIGGKNGILPSVRLSPISKPPSFATIKKQKKLFLEDIDTLPPIVVPKAIKRKQTKNNNNKSPTEKRIKLDATITCTKDDSMIGASNVIIASVPNIITTTTSPLQSQTNTVSPTPSDQSVDSKENNFIPKIKKAVSRSLAHNNLVNQQRHSHQKDQSKDQKQSYQKLETSVYNTNPKRSSTPSQTKSQQSTNAATTIVTAIQSTTSSASSSGIESFMLATGSVTTVSSGVVNTPPQPPPPSSSSSSSSSTTSSNKASQRYSSDDLYKPRPILSGSRSRRRGYDNSDL